ncbi:unnamed protein product [Bathycoccus prasinos]
MGKSEVYLTSFDVSPVEYFDLMLDTVVQQEIHTSKDGLNMSVWRASDGPLLGVPNGTSRVVFSEPDLKVPKFLKKWVQKAQSYNEYSDFYPPKLGDDGDGDDGEDGGKGANRARTTSKRECVVVPHVGANRMTMTFTEYYMEHEESTARNPKCLVRSEVFVEVRAPIIGSKMEQWILNTSREKVEERDAFVRRMLEKSKEKRGKSKGLEKRGKNEKWRRKFYSSQWFEEDSALEESESVVEAKEFLNCEPEANPRITSGSNESEVKMESLESFPIPRTKGLRRVFSACDLAF